jgi:hypothetical protein
MLLISARSRWLSAIEGCREYLKQREDNGVRARSPAESGKTRLKNKEKKYTATRPAAGLVSDHRCGPDPNRQDVRTAI